MAVEKICLATLGVFYVLTCITTQKITCEYQTFFILLTLPYPSLNLLHLHCSLSFWNFFHLL